jgi:hypothetical protein
MDVCVDESGKNMQPAGVNLLARRAGQIGAERGNFSIRDADVCHELAIRGDDVSGAQDKVKRVHDF